MAKIKLTKTVVDTARSQSHDIELRDTIVPGFLCKVTPTGRKVFMLQYRTNAGVRRKPSLGQFGELTVEQARSLAQDWLAEVRRGGDPGHDKAEARKAPTVKELKLAGVGAISRSNSVPESTAGWRVCAHDDRGQTPSAAAVPPSASPCTKRRRENPGSVRPGKDLRSSILNSRTARSRAGYDQNERLPRAESSATSASGAERRDRESGD